MREAKSYRDPYHGIKRTSAMSGPHRRANRYCWQRIVLTIVGLGSLWAAAYYTMKALTQ